ncbi:MAG: GNAT family N-acetyltransferase [Myxococcota bacterium]|nr:GNAT family N-acetyltransferase [Myxococcota bacterium]
MSAVERLSTKRVFATRVSEEHRANFHRVASNPLAMATLGGFVDVTVQDRMFDAQRSHWDKHGFGSWMWFETSSDRHLGHAGLLRFDELGGDDVELAYAFHPDAWGFGFAEEVAECVVCVAFEDLELESIVACTLPTNFASRRLMERAGFRYERDFLHAGRTHVLCRLRAAARA